MKLCVTIGFTVYIYRDPTYLMVMPPYSLADLSRPLFPYVHIDSNDAFQVRKASFYHFPIPFFFYSKAATLKFTAFSIRRPRPLSITTNGAR